MHIHGPWCMWIGKDNLEELFFFSHFVGHQAGQPVPFPAELLHQHKKYFCKVKMLLGIIAHSYNSSIPRLRQKESHQFKVSLGYLVSSGSAEATV